MGDVFAHGIVKYVCAADVIRMAVAVDEMSDWLVRHAFDGGLELVADRWRTVDEDDANIADEKDCLIDSFGDEIRS